MIKIDNEEDLLKHVQLKQARNMQILCRMFNKNESVRKICINATSFLDEQIKNIPDYIITSEQRFFHLSQELIDIPKCSFCNIFIPYKGYYPNSCCIEHTNIIRKEKTLEKNKLKKIEIQKESLLEKEKRRCEKEEKIRIHKLHKKEIKVKSQEKLKLERLEKKIKRKEEKVEEKMTIKRNKEELRLKNEYEKSINTYSYVKCEICGLYMKHLYTHVKLHEIDVKQYSIMFPNHKICSQEFSDNLSENSKGEKNINHKSHTTKEDRQSRSPFCKQFYKNRFPNKSEEELEKMVHENHEEFTKDRINNTTIQYWINKGFSEEEAIVKLSERQKTFTMEKLISKYGEEEGSRKWNDRQKKWKAKVFNKDQHISRGTSKVSEKMIESIIELLPSNINLLYGKNEKFISAKDRERIFKYDLTDPIKKKIIEFNGDFWHCNPDKYDSHYYHKIKKMTAMEIWSFDNDKINLAIENGYEVLVIWENDWTKNPEKVLMTCIEFLDYDGK